jgi:outer membrane scaffolding protein for murein synthesis (MipA/OmpV family)
MRRGLAKRQLAVCLAVLALAACVAARAEQPLWELGVGAAAVRLPHYRGAAQSHSWLLPLPYFVYRGDFLKADRDGTRAVLFNSDRVDFDLSLAATAPTRSHDNAARSGMPDLPATLEFGPNLNLTLARSAAWKFDLRLPVRAGITLQRQPGRTGFSAAPHLNLDLRAEGWNLGLQAGPQWGDQRRHAYFYDVAPAFASSERPAYRARGGFAGWDATVALSRRSGSLWTGMYLRADSVAGARFEGSPLVKSRSNWSAGIAMAWVLKTSDQRVADAD